MSENVLSIYVSVYFEAEHDGAHAKAPDFYLFET